MSDALWLHSLQHTRLPCPSLSPWACSNSCLLSQWCHPAITSSVVSFSSCPQSFPASESFSINQFFPSGGQSIRASALILPMNIQSWFLLRLTGLIPCCPKNSQESSPAPQFESIHSLVLSLHYGPALTSIRDYWKNHSFDSKDFVSKVMFLPLINCLDLSKLSSMEQASFNFMAAITICSDSFWFLVKVANCQCKNQQTLWHSLNVLCNFLQK